MEMDILAIWVWRSVNIFVCLLWNPSTRAAPRPVISPVLEEIAGLHIPLTSESDMIVLTSERGLGASFLSVVGALL